MTRALFIGRFQPLHKGHLNALTSAVERYELVVGIGSAQEQGTKDNPLSADERQQILEHCLDDPVVVRFPDQEDNDTWTDMVAETVDFDVVVSGNELVRKLLGDRGYVVEDPDYLKPEQYSGTHIRERIAAGDDWEHLIPGCSLELLQRYDFERRVQDIFAQD